MQVCDTASPFTVCAHSYYMYEVTCLPLCHTEGEVTAVLSAITNICSEHNKNLVQCKFIALCLFQHTVPACYTFTRHADSLSTARTDPAYKGKFLCTWHPHLLEYLHQCFQLLLNSLLMAACCVSIDFTYTLQAFHKTDWALSIVVCWGMCWNSWTETNSYQGRILEGWGCHFFFLFWKPKIFSVREIKQVASLLYVWKDGDWCSKVSHVKDPQILNVWSRREGGSETSQGLCHLIHLFYWWPSVAVINRS